MENNRNLNDVGAAICSILRENKEILEQSDDESLRKEAESTLELGKAFRDLLGQWLEKVASRMEKKE
jgi:hypothetical protein